MNIKLNEGLPVDYGGYIFLLTTGDLQEGFYDSYAHPHGTAVKVCYDYGDESFEYYSDSEILGHIYYDCQDSGGTP